MSMSEAQPVTLHPNLEAIGMAGWSRTRAGPPRDGAAPYTARRNGGRSKLERIEPGLLDALWLGVLILVSGVSAWSGARAVRDARQAPPAELTAAQKRSIYRQGSATLWTLAAGTLVWWIVAGRDLASLGLAAPRWTWSAAGAALALIIWLAADTARQTAPSRIRGTRERWRLQNPYIPVSGAEFRSFAVLAVSAGICEEIAYRGFMIAVLRAWLGSGWAGAALAVGLPALFFGAAHAAQGWRGVASAAGGALAWGFMVIETGSILPVIVFHVLWDLLMGMLGFRLLRPSSTGT